MRAAFILAQCVTALSIIVVSLGSPVVAFLMLPVLGMFLLATTFGSLDYAAINAGVVSIWDQPDLHGRLALDPARHDAQVDAR